MASNAQTDASPRRRDTVSILLGLYLAVVWIVLLGGLVRVKDACLNREMSGIGRKTGVEGHVAVLVPRHLLAHMSEAWNAFKARK